MERLRLIPASEIEPRQVPMIWRGRIPASTLTLVAGKPGLGKSTLLVTVAAELSKLGVPGIVSMLEDDAAGIIRPRLDVAGADTKLVHLLPPDAAPTLPADLDLLRDTIAAVDARYVILDPIAAHFKPERRVHDRPTLRELIAVARETRCAIIGVHHTVKSAGDGTALSRIGGPSSGLAGTARAVYLYGYDPADEDRRALACAKINGFEEPPTLILEHDTVEYAAGGRPIEAGLLNIVEETNAQANQVMKRGRGHKKRDAAATEWLSKFLAGGDDCKRQVSEIRAAGKKAGFGWQTVQRARVQIKAERVRVGFGGDGFWLWRLADDHPLRVGEAVEVE